MDVHEAINSFIAQLAAGHSPKTVSTYQTALRQLEGYLGGEGVTDVKDINPAAFLSTLADKSPATVATYAVAVARFGEFANDEGILSNGKYARFQRRLKRARGRAKSRTLPKVPTEKVFQDVMAQAHRNPPNAGLYGPSIRQNLARLRNVAMLETLRSTGCRVAEICDLRREHLEVGRIRVTGKGNKTRYVYVDELAQKALGTYLDLRGDSDPDNPVFARHDRRASGTKGQIKALSTTSVRNVINMLAEQAGHDPASISPHKFRHRFATKVLEATGNLAVAQDAMGHASPVTTRVYAKLADSHMATTLAGVNLA